MKKHINPKDPNNVEITSLVKDWVTKKFEIDNHTTVEVLEISCPDGCCPNAQTKIIIHSHPHYHFVIGKPLTYIRQWDIKLLQKNKTI